MEKYILNQETVEIIKQLQKKKIKLGLLSNFPSSWIYKLLKKYDLERYFNKVIISSEVGMIKPHADIFQEALRQLGALPSEAIFIDDREINVNGSKALEYMELYLKTLSN